MHFDDHSLRYSASLTIILFMCLSIKSPRLISMVLALPALSGCGYAEWPASNKEPYDINQPPQYISGNSNNLFLNARGVVVGKGDTVFAISKRHRIPMRALIEANNLKAPFILNIGQSIVLPRGKSHRIVRGDTLFGIANTYDVNPFELARINDLKKPFNIYVGNRLTLPRGVNIRAISTLRTSSKSQKKAPSYSIKTKQKKSLSPDKPATPPKPKTVKSLNLTREVVSDPPETS
jgi:LysM repeat protein